ncbi:MAG: helix-turn-helix domain-containing protein [Elusimicrobia bacterium]|nr:helix-turn-helix domain-containing protein [Elusimicrobiota bacterium]
MTVQTLEKQVQTHPVSSKDVRWLYTHFPPITINGHQSHVIYKKVVEFLFNNKKTGGEFRSYLESVIHFLDEYEKKHFPSAASPEDILRFLMNQHKLSQSDLKEELGGQSVVSNIMSGKRQLTREHIEKLSRRFSISPASFYCQSAA